MQQPIHSNQSRIEQEELRIRRDIVDAYRYDNADQKNRTLQYGKDRQQCHGEPEPSIALVISVDRTLRG
jgi:hypothetical protein